MFSTDVSYNKVYLAPLTFVRFAHKMNIERLRLTQHKRFVPYGTHPNSAIICAGGYGEN